MFVAASPLCLSPAEAAETDVSALLAKLRAVGAKAQGNREAVDAWRALSLKDAARLPEILAGMDGAGPLATNYIRAAVDTIAERALAGGGKLPVAKLEAFLLNPRHAPRGRRVAYEWLAKVDPTAPDRLIPKMLDDPSLELRRDAVARVIETAEKARAAKKKADATAAYSKALAAARDLDQIKACSKQLRELGGKVDLPGQMGFLMSWRLIGPFDNIDKKGYDVPYAPEKQIDLKATHQGKLGPVKWIEHTTKDDFGIVDLAKAIDKHKGAIIYATTEFHSDTARDVDLRLGCINANKLWLNGKLISKHEVYHANMVVDQYTSRVKLRAGRNVILLKICQNEQTETWAQRWQFQLRVCDTIGTAIASRR